MVIPRRNPALSRRLLLTPFLALVLGAASHAETLTVVGFNVESGGSDPKLVAEQIRGIGAGAQLWGLAEVESAGDLAIFEQAADTSAKADFRQILGTTGDEDRLAILYNADRLELVGSEELGRLNPRGKVRAPLVGCFQVRGSDVKFLFVVNHLYRGSAEGRHEQAEGLNGWAQGQRLPIIAVGDYNFDWSVREGERDHDRGYDLMTEGGVFRWVRPERLFRSQCSKHDSILDFVFVANGARQWKGASRILAGDSGYCRDYQNSDHRPVLAAFEVP